MRCGNCSRFHKQINCSRKIPELCRILLILNYGSLKNKFLKCCRFCVHLSHTCCQITKIETTRSTAPNKDQMLKTVFEIKEEEPILLRLAMSGIPASFVICFDASPSFYLNHSLKIFTFITFLILPLHFITLSCSDLGVISSRLPILHILLCIFLKLSTTLSISSVISHFLPAEKFNLVQHNSNNYISCDI